MASIQEDLARWIADQTDLTFSDTNATIFVDRQPSAPDNAVSVMGAGGVESDTHNYDKPSLQILIRGGSNPTWALAKWEEIFGLINRLRNTWITATTYVVSAIPTQTGPVPLGPDDNGRLEYSMNVRLETLSKKEQHL